MNILSLFSVICFLLIINTNIVSSQNINTAIEAINYLANEEMEGRFPGTKGDIKTIEYLISEFESYGVKPFEFGYKQKFNIVSDISHGKNTTAKIDNRKLKLDKDYLPFNFSNNDELSAQIIIDNKLNKAGADYNGKWVLYYLPIDTTIDYKSIINLAIKAQHLGAGGFILLTDKSNFSPFVHNRSVSPIGIPAIQLSNKALKKYFKIDISELSNGTIIPIELYVNVDNEKIYSETANVAGYLKSDQTNYWIVIGAHHDHLGWGGPNSGSRTPETKAIHYGADDNASGTAMVLMLAEYFSKNPIDCNIAFVLFGAEEQGLIGSKYFVENLPFNKDNIKVMLNYDMVGRMNENKLTLIGSTTAVEFDSLIQTLPEHKLEISLRGGGYSGSDQASFYSEKIPVLFFYTGTHNDYHTPADVIELINFGGMELTASLSVSIVDLFAKPEITLTYQEVEQKSKNRHGGEMKVKLGIMPDITDDSGNGLRIDGVVPGGTAYNAKMQKGDIITELDGTKISGIYDYMHVMSDFKEGQTVKAKVIRNNKIIDIELKF